MRSLKYKIIAISLSLILIPSTASASTWSDIIEFLFGTGATTLEDPPNDGGGGGNTN